MALDVSDKVTSLLTTLCQPGYAKLVDKGRTYDNSTFGGTESETVTDLVAGKINLDSTLIDGELIKATDTMFIMDNQVTPSMEDFIRADGVDYSIIRIMEINPSGVVQAYKVVARG